MGNTCVSCTSAANCAAGQGVLQRRLRRYLEQHRALRRLRRDLRDRQRLGGLRLGHLRRRALLPLTRTAPRARRTAARSTPASRSRYCGACGARLPANSAASCAAGVCGIATCNGTFRDCDTSASNGCEVDSATSLAHCGACGSACAPASATGTCAAGACGVAACAAGYADCDMTAANGCEVNTGTSVAHCGGCGVVCAPAHATGACAAGACGVAACAPRATATATRPRPTAARWTPRATSRTAAPAVRAARRGPTPRCRARRAPARSPAYRATPTATVTRPTAARRRSTTRRTVAAAPTAAR